MPEHGRQVVIVVLALVVLMAISGPACSSGAASRPQAATFGPGTPLRSGLVVPPGARLVGGIFPYSARTGSFIAYEGPLGWIAVLQVLRPGPSVFDDLDSQIEHTPVSTAGAMAECTKGADYVACETQATDVTLKDGSHDVWMLSETGTCAPAARTPPLGPGPPTPLDYLVITVSPPADAPGGMEHPDGAPIPTVDYQRAREPTPTGRLLNPGLAGSSYAPAPVHLEPGTVLASRPVEQCTDAEASPSWAVARVTAPVKQVIDRYTQQFRGYDTTHDYSETVGAERISGVWMDEAGGDLRALTIVARPGQPSWALIHTSTDP